MKYVTKIRIHSGIIEVNTPSGWWWHFPKTWIYKSHGGRKKRPYIVWLHIDSANEMAPVISLSKLPLPLRYVLPKYEWMFVSPLSWEIVKYPAGVTYAYQGKHKIEMPRI